MHSHNHRGRGKFSGSGRGHRGSGGGYRGGGGRRGRGGKKNFKKFIHPNSYVSYPDLENQVETKSLTEGDESFVSLSLTKSLEQNLQTKGFIKMSPIQALTIPKALQGENVVGIAQTGSGKTGAFLIPMVNKAVKDQNERIIIITPTRELAMQILKETITLTRSTSVRSELVIGGESMQRQMSNLRRDPQIIIGTPGRLIDMGNQGHINFKKFNNVVIDEVDRMLDMGFKDDILDIYNQTNPDRQTLLFSATLDKKIKSTIETIVHKYEFVEIEANKAVANITQDVVSYSHKDEKFDILRNILNALGYTKMIIFVDTKIFADKLVSLLSSQDYRADALHGDKRQNQRRRIIESYKRDHFDILVATNVAARGLDIDDVTHVINYDEPENYDEYVHRVGRTGRNGKTGTAYTFVPSSNLRQYKIDGVDIAKIESIERPEKKVQNYESYDNDNFDRRSRGSGGGSRGRRNFRGNGGSGRGGSRNSSRGFGGRSRDGYSDRNDRGGNSRGRRDDRGSGMSSDRNTTMRRYSDSDSSSRGNSGRNSNRSSERRSHSNGNRSRYNNSRHQ